MGLRSVLLVIVYLMTISKAYEVFDDQPCMSRLSTVYTALNHTVNLSCSFWSETLKWTKPDNASASSTSREILTLYPPIIPGYYTCSSTPCNHLFSVRACPSEVTFVSYSTEPLLTLDCSLSGNLVSWSFNHTRFVQRNLVTKTSYSKIPEALSKYFLSSITHRYSLTLFSPFIPGTYTCHSGDCSRTIELVYHPVTKSSPAKLLSSPANHQAPTPHARLESPPLRAAAGSPNIAVIIAFACLALILCCSVYCFASPCQKNRLSIPYIRQWKRETGSCSARNTLISC